MSRASNVQSVTFKWENNGILQTAVAKEFFYLFIYRHLWHKIWRRMKSFIVAFRTEVTIDNICFLPFFFFLSFFKTNPCNLLFICRPKSIKLHSCWNSEFVKEKENNNEKGQSSFFSSGEYLSRLTFCRIFPLFSLKRNTVWTYTWNLQRSVGNRVFIQTMKGARAGVYNPGHLLIGKHAYFIQARNRITCCSYQLFSKTQRVPPNGERSFNWNVIPIKMSWRYSAHEYA